MTKQFLLLLSCLALFSCQTYEQVSIDYMVPAEITFPLEFRKVGIVNNVPKVENDSVGTLPADASVAALSLAETVALTNYFDEVIICDSALRANDAGFRESFLTSAEVRQLTDELDVDFIISMEDILLKLDQKLYYRPEWNAHQITADMKAYSFINIYSERRSEPIVKYIAQDSIFWEGYGANEESARANLINYKRMTQEGSQFAGTIAVPYLIPHWKSVTRTIFNGGSVHLRDAGYNVRKNNWDEAYSLWIKEFESTKSEKKKMWCANNIAVYYEMKDEITEALTWINKARDIAFEIYGNPSGQERAASFFSIPYYHFFALYSNELSVREAALPKLILQMQRHNDNF